MRSVRPISAPPALGAWEVARASFVLRWQSAAATPLSRVPGCRVSSVTTAAASAITYGVPASAGGIFVVTEPLEIHQGRARPPAPPPKGGTPYPRVPPFCTAVAERSGDTAFARAGRPRGFRFTSGRAVRAVCPWQFPRPACGRKRRRRSRSAGAVQNAALTTRARLPPDPCPILAPRWARST